MAKPAAVKSGPPKMPSVAIWSPIATQAVDLAYHGVRSGTVWLR